MHYVGLLTIPVTIGRKIVVMAALLVTSVILAVMADKHMTIPQIGQPSKKFKVLPIASDSPDT